MISKTAEANMQVVTISSDPVDELIINATARSESGPSGMLERVLDTVREAGAVPVAQRVFAGHGHDALHEVCSEIDWPVTRLTLDADPMPASTQLYALRGCPVEYLRCNGRPVASVFHRGGTRWCRIGNVRPEDGSKPPTEQAREVFEQLLRILDEADLELDDLVRTWFYLDDILLWYGGFNRVRNDFFTRHGVYDGLIPASTGIGRTNAAGRALAAEALVIACGSGQTRRRAVASPAQCAALKYGSSFSRAVEVIEQNHRRVYVSGTASLDNEGRTICKEDFEGQLDVTLQAVEKILNSRGMQWADTVRAIAYAPRPRDMAALQRRIEPLELPVAVVLAVVCRDDLLFELELDAIRDISSEPAEKARDAANQAVSNLCRE